MWPGFFVAKFHWLLLIVTNRKEKNTLENLHEKGSVCKVVYIWFWSGLVRLEKTFLILL